MTSLYELVKIWEALHIQGSTLPPELTEAKAKLEKHIKDTIDTLRMMKPAD